MCFFVVVVVVEILSKSLENLIRKKSINQNLYVKKEQSNKLNQKSYGTKAQDNVTSFKNINKWLN